MSVAKEKPLLDDAFDRRAVFVDTGAWVALRYLRDSYHGRAVALLRRIRAEGIEMVTTDHVLAETVTLLKARGAVLHALALGDAIIDGKVARFVEINGARRRRAWELFRRYRNLRAGYVDCTSFAVMEELGLQAVFGFDSDFEAARFKLLG
jgi:hypothetical protein